MDSNLSNSTATVAFRDEIHRLLHPTKTRSELAHGRANEAWSLLPRNHQGPSRLQLLKRVFFNQEYTPGLDSANPVARWSAGAWHVTKITLLCSPVNILLVFVPIGIVAGKAKCGAAQVFVLNFLAIVPLAAMLSFATEQTADQVGDSLGGLMNATFGNAVELIVSIIALRAGQIEVVQSSMLGSILSNILLVLGMCFFVGGIWNMKDEHGRGQEQEFASVTAQTTCSLMALSTASMIIPGALYNMLDRAEGKEDGHKEGSVLTLSRATSFILLLLYVLYLIFQMKTHSNLFDPRNKHAELNLEAGEGEAQVAEEEDEPLVKIGVVSAVSVLVFSTLVISVCADYLISSIDAIVSEYKISRTFIGLILIPIVGNAAEHVSACVCAVKNKMDLAMGVAIGSSVQIALFVTPFLVILGWAIDSPMSLHFETFETVAFATSVLVVAYTVQDGKSNYLEGAMLMGLYIIIAVAFWASPN